MARRRECEVPPDDVDVARLWRERDRMARRLAGLERKRAAGKPTTPDWFEHMVRHRLAELDEKLERYER
jgi:hypothetical protein